MILAWNEHSLGGPASLLHDSMSRSIEISLRKNRLKLRSAFLLAASNDEACWLSLGFKPSAIGGHLDPIAQRPRFDLQSGSVLGSHLGFFPALLMVMRYGAGY